jgi:hypothetical protein
MHTKMVREVIYQNAACEFQCSIYMLFIGIILDMHAPYVCRAYISAYLNMYGYIVKWKSHSYIRRYVLFIGINVKAVREVIYQNAACEF